jgi:predicted nuclease with TOPRIM domain
MTRPAPRKGPTPPASRPAEPAAPTSGPAASSSAAEDAAEAAATPRPTGGAVARTDEGAPGGPPALRAPLDTIAHAMKAQVELLRQMQERQRSLEDAVRDERRHDLVVNSAESLNESFKSMRDSQERLADRLEESRGGMPTATRVLLVIGVLTAAGAATAIAYFFRRGADEIRTATEKLAAPRSDAEARAAIDDLAARVKNVEASEREAFRTELERLRAAVDQGSVEREALRKERDVVREELGQLRVKAGEGERTVAELRAKLEGSDKEIARLTTQSVGDQRLIAQLNNTVEILKTRGGAGSAAPAPTPPAPEGDAAAVADGDLARRIAESLGGGAASQPTTEAARAEPPPAPAQDAREAPFTPGQRDDLNALLLRHRGRQKYSVASATKILDRKLKNVVLEVRGADGSLDKTIEAESMTVRISPRGEMADLDFEKGHVVYHGSMDGGARDAKSPFFNDRYQIVLLGAPSKDWLAGGLAFVAMR